MCKWCLLRWCLVSIRVPYQMGLVPLFDLSGELLVAVIASKSFDGGKAACGRKRGYKPHLLPAVGTIGWAFHG